MLHLQEQVTLLQERVARLTHDQGQMSVVVQNHQGRMRQVMLMANFLSTQFGQGWWAQ